MESFRTGAKVVRLNVNDDGYCVELNVANDAWIKAFLDYVDDAQKNADTRQKTIDNTEDSAEKLNQIIEFDEDIKAGFEKVFGEKSYVEVFGSDLVGCEYVIEFLEACMPYIETRVNQRNKALEKYNANKTGGAR